ncbi:unnamed protein product [Rotaria sp. Silwood2]|nr:unnamed protein product [Rotaria sp. Silwood2]
MKMKAGEVEFCLHKNDTTGALKTLGEIIQELMSKNDYVHDEQLEDMLIMSCVKRININFKEKNYYANEMEAVKENFGVHFNTQLIFSKEVQKPVKTKK